MSEDTVTYMEPQGHGGELRRVKAPDRILEDEIVVNPGDYGWPPTLALEVAMQSMPLKDICASYNITRDKWDVIRKNRVFIAELTSAMEALRQDGAAFKARAGLQSLGLLKKSWQMIHDPAVPHAVQADLIKHTVRVAGLDASKDQGAFGKAGVGGGGFMIHINLGG